MTLNSPEPPRLSHWLRRLWPLYCFLAALVTFGYAIYDSYQIDGDAVAYMDIGDLMRAHNWHGIINGYWNTLYPAALDIGNIVFLRTYRPTQTLRIPHLILPLRLHLRPHPRSHRLPSPLPAPIPPPHRRLCRACLHLFLPRRGPIHRRALPPEVPLRLRGLRQSQL